MTTPAIEIPKGYCQCGCGRKTNVALQTNERLGHVKGEPYRFVQHHGRRTSPVDFTVEDRGYETPCWIWRLCTQDSGYAQITINGVSRLVHRVYYERHRGPIPKGRQLDHLCLQRSCVNPDHLEAVPAFINVRRQSSTKLTYAKAQEIRRRARRGESPANLGRHFGVAARTIRDALQFKTWVMPGG